MNNCILIGRLTKDPEVRYTEQQLAIARFDIAISRGKDKEGKDRGADFPNIVVFGKQAENCERFLAKGRQIAIQGHIQTGSYTNKDGNKVYTTDVVADRIEFLERKDKESNRASAQQDDIPEGFSAIDEDEIPF